jgi:type I restriction enzyme S subunit
MSNHPWPTDTVGGLFDIGAGKAMSPSARLGDRTYPFLRTANVFWGQVDLSKLDTMNFSEDEIEYKSLRNGDLLVCEGGDIGRSAVWQGQVEKCGFQNHIHRLRRKADNVVPAFFMYYLQAGFTQLGIYAGAGNKTTIPNLSRGRLAALEVPKPPTLEQEKIAATLWKIQRAIQVEQKLTDIARELKHSVMRKLFTQGLRNEPQKDTEIGPVPKSWEVVQLQRHLKLAQYGLSLRGQQSGSYPILRMNCQLDGHVLFRDLQYVDLNEKVFAAFRIADGDLLFNRTNSFELVGRTAIFHSQRDAVFASYLIRLSLDQTQLDPDFINFYFNQPCIQADLKRLASRGVSQSNISASKLKEYLIPKATLNEQREIAEILQSIDRKISLHERKCATLTDLFQTLLHQLMTAEVRIDKLDIDTSEITALNPKPT